MMQISKKLVVIAISTLLVLSASVSFLVYSNSKEDVVEDLEAMDLVITHLDIVGSNGNALIIEGNLVTSNTSSGGGSGGIQPKELYLELYYEDEYIEDVSVPLESDFISGENSKDTVFTFELEIPETTSGEPGDETFNEFLDNIIQLKDFEVDFDAVLTYDFLGFSDSIAFSNKLLFDLDQPTIDFQLDHIDIPNENGSGSLLYFSIFNPFSSSFLMSGEIEFTIGDYYFADVLISEQVRVDANWSEAQGDLVFFEAPADVIAYVFDHYEEDLTLIADLELEIGEAKFGLVFEYNANDIGSNGDGEDTGLLSIGIYRIKGGIEVDLEAGTLDAVFDLFIDYNFPLSFNVSSISLNITTLGGTPLSTVNWQSEEPVPILLDNITIFEDMQLNASGLSSGLLLQILADSAVSIPEGEIVIKFYTQEIIIPFSIDRAGF